ncbi:MAG: toll/interleukin-1 receptor domain-containing protein [Solirubrobacteraceae bacterium]
MTTEPIDGRWAGELVGPWETGRFRLFVSHTSTNAPFAQEIREALRQIEVDALVAHASLSATTEWQREIESALRTCDALVALLTPDFSRSEWCNQEVGYAMARGALVIPVRLGAAPHGFLGKYQALTPQVGGSGRTLAPALLEVLARHTLTSFKMAQPITVCYSRSNSHYSARKALRLLQHIPYENWTAALVQSVQDAAATNQNIREAMVLPDADHTVAEAATDYLASLGLADSWT